MSEPKKNDFIETLWSMDEKALANFMKARVGQPDFETALVILQMKTLVETRQVARWTRFLTYATFALAIVAVAALFVS